MKSEQAVGGWKLDKKIADVLRAALGKDGTRYALGHVLATERTLVASDGAQLVEIEIDHGISPGLYRLDKTFLMPAADAVKLRYPEYQTLWPVAAKPLAIRHPENVARSFTIAALTHQNCLDVWQYEKTLKAVDKLKIWELVVEVQPPWEWAPAVLIAKSRTITVRAMFMPVNPEKYEALYRGPWPERATDEKE